MTSGSAIAAIVDALGLPGEARVERRVPKKLLTEQGAPTAADKRAIQDGIEDLHWLAALKPSTVAIPAFKDEMREYLEIAVVAAAYRETAKVARLTELIHRAIPYPVMLLTAAADGAAISLAHKRSAQNEAGKTVIDRVVEAKGLHPDAPSSEEGAFLKSLRLAGQPRQNLFALYEGWLARVEALAAARLSGVFSVTDEAAAVVRRREAIDACTRLSREIAGLSSKARKEKQMNRRVTLNLEIQRLEAELAQKKTYL